MIEQLSYAQLQKVSDYINILFSQAEETKLDDEQKELLNLLNYTIDIDFQKLNFTRKQGGDHTFRISPTDDTVKFNFWKSIAEEEILQNSMTVIYSLK